LEFIIFFAAVVVTVFTTIEIGIYTSIGASVLLLLVRIARPRGAFLGRVVVQKTSDKGPLQTRDVFLPLPSTVSGHQEGVVNPEIKVIPPAPGVIIYRFEESFLYPNSSYVSSLLMDYIKSTTRRGRDMTNVSLSSRPWNDPAPRYAKEDDPNEIRKPLLKAIVLDMSAVGHLDTTSVQNLIDARKEAESWAHAPVEFHFANILSPWIRRALIAGGFGLANPERNIPTEVAPVFTHYLSQSQVKSPGGFEEGGDAVRRKSVSDEESQVSSHVAPVISTDTPFFHLDLLSAVRAAEEVADGYEK